MCVNVRNNFDKSIYSHKFCDPFVVKFVEQKRAGSTKTAAQSFMSILNVNIQHDNIWAYVDRTYFNWNILGDDLNVGTCKK